MTSLFIDTWGWIAYLNKKDQAHDKVRDLLDNEVLVSGTELFTSHSVIAETINHIVRKGERWLGGKGPVRESNKSFREFVDNDFVKVIL